MTLHALAFGAIFYAPMSTIFAMGTPFTADDRGYFLWLSHNWQIFIPPVVMVLAIIAGWIFRRVHHSSSGDASSHGEPLRINSSEQPSSSAADQIPGTDLPFELQGA